ncbi:basic-leucine zipper transcription factor family protein [Striga asiatica]|uniref:Basic-leucine zipper transcription factor family protein n=1 Tax=Striga asiatica TaxID=4170 RepID=A0A5A7QN57_STRAF|nr:basic-leucine zipper transcription factor family protein [Striga asiatica]
MPSLAASLHLRSPLLDLVFFLSSVLVAPSTVSLSSTTHSCPTSSTTSPPSPALWSLSYAPYPPCGSSSSSHSPRLAHHQRLRLPRWLLPAIVHRVPYRAGRDPKMCRYTTPVGRSRDCYIGV